MKKNLKKKLYVGAAVFVAVFGCVCAWEFFAPVSLTSGQAAILYRATAGVGSAGIAEGLQEQGVRVNPFFFQLYAVLTGKRTQLQAGLYDISPSDSVAAIVNKMATGDVATYKVTVLEGWDTGDLANYLEVKKIYNKEEFTAAINRDYSKEFDFLKGKPADISVEGFLFPATYKVPVGISAEDFVRMCLNNFNKRLTADMRKQIKASKKSIFQVVTMASIIEKEVPTLAEKKIIAGILWKRITSGMPLQVDATINYITGKNDAGATLADTKIDSPYNTYKYYGLPLGPISSPGIDSLTAALSPVKTDYWFWFSTGGKTFYSKTYQEHSASVRKYLN